MADNPENIPEVEDRLKRLDDLWAELDTVRLFGFVPNTYYGFCAVFKPSLITVIHFWMDPRSKNYC